MKFELTPELSVEVKKIADTRGIKVEDAIEVVARYGISRVKALSKFYKAKVARDNKARKPAPKAKAAKPKGPLARKTAAAKAAPKAKAPRIRKATVKVVDDVKGQVDTALAVS